MKQLTHIVACCLLTALFTQNIFGQNNAATASQLPANTLAQIRALQQEKFARSPAQKKMDSHLVHASKRAKGQQIAAGVTHLMVEPLVDAENMVLVDLRATVTPRLLEIIRKAGGKVINSFSEHDTIRARLPIGVVEDVASDEDVKSIRAADLGYTNVGSVTSEADATHRAGSSRTNFAVNGSGIKVGVLSDSSRFLGNSIASGDLDNSVVVLPGQSGIGTEGPDTGEGTAMLELVHDIVPGAQLYFATGKDGMPAMASNILALRDLGCRVIIDDLTYPTESPFQDGVIDQAIQKVSDSGVLYFSSAANSGNLDSGQSSTWEGDFNLGVYVNGIGTFHDWGGLNYANQVLRGGTNTVVLFWAEPISIASSDYDLFTYDPAGNVVSLGNATTADAFETAFARPNDRIAVVLANGTQKFIHAEVIRGGLRTATSGSTRGHNAPTAANAFGVAATPVRGPFPAAFSAANVVENFSSDGPRRKFFYATGSPMTPGNFSSSGGIVYQKPDITAADGVTMSGAFTANSGFQPFYGTSAAAPHAGAIAALLLSYKPSLTPAQVRAALQNTAIDIHGAGWDRNSGWGIIMADRALASVSPPPDIQITAPVAGPGYNSVPTITGTATDHSYSGLQLIDLTIAQGSDFWNGSSWVPTQTVLHRAPGTSWAYSSVPNGINLRGGSYVVSAVAMDNASHTSSVASVTFQVDTTPPTITFSPLNNQQSVFNFQQVGGTISEAGTVQFKIEWYKTGGNEFWNGVLWSTDDSDANTLLMANVAGLNWTASSGTLPSRAQTFPGNYLIHAIVTDTAGNTNNNSLVLARSPLDTTPPIVNLDSTSIHSGEVFTNRFLPPVSGLAYDYESGVALVNVLLARNTGSGLVYWDGASWTATPTNLSATYSATNISWHLNAALPGGASLPNATYFLNISAANNEAPSVSVFLNLNFSVDYHPVFVFTAGSYADLDPFNNNMRWDNSANWDVGQVPTADAIVVINNHAPDNTALGSVPIYRLDLSGGTLSTSGMLIQKLNLSGGTLAGGAITIVSNGVFNWSGGTFTGIGSIPSGATLNLSGASHKYLGINTTLNLVGNVVWTGTGSLYGAYGDQINNTGTFSIQGDALLSNYTGGAPAPVFNNNGLIQKTNSPGVTTMAADAGGWTFNNNGTLDIASGVLSSQTQLYLNHGTVIAGAGILRVDGSTTLVSGTNKLQPGATFELAGGTVTGTNTFTGTGAFNWSGGTVTATLTSQSNIAFNISGAAIKTLSINSTINSAGSATWTGTGAIYAGYGSVLNNTGSFVVQNDALYYNNTGGATLPQFSNYGTFTKTNSPGTTDFNSQYGTAFNNYGTVKVQSGKLALGGGGNSLNSSFTAAAGSVIDYYGGTFFHNGNLELNGPGTNRVNGATVVFNGVTNLLAGAAIFEIAAGQINGTNTFSGVGAVHWSGGSVSAVFNLQSNIALNISGASAKVLSPGGNFTVAGNTLWNGAGDIYVGYASTFINNGTFSVQNDAQFYNNTGGAPIPVFVNNGTFLKNGGTGATTFLPNYGGVTLNNTGTLDLQSGTLVIQAGYATAPSARLQISIGGPTAATQFGTEYFYSPALFDGTLAVSLVNGFMPTNGQSFVLANYGSRTGQFANIEVPALTPELQWSLSYGATALTLSVIRPHRVSSPVRLANGYFQFTLSGASAARAIIDASENLVSWQPIRTNAPFNGSFLFDDANAASYTNRFYRIRIEP